MDETHVTRGVGGVFQQAVTDETITSIIDVVEGQGYTIKFEDPSHNEFKRVKVENPGITEISGTSDPLLYQSERNGDDFWYNLPCASGDYLLRLHFSENFHDSAGQRKFDVKAEGNLILNDFDIFAAAGGRNIAKVVTIPVAVADDELNLEFFRVLYQAEVAAIELVKPGTGDIAGTSDDPLYHDSRSGDFSYDFNLPNGTYNVSLSFAERYFNASGKRKFQVKVEGNVALNNFDIFAAAGGTDTANIQTFPVTVSDGTLNLEFIGMTGSAKLAALKITQQQSGTPVLIAAINAGGASFTAADGTLYHADTYFTGGQADTPGGTVLAINCGGGTYTASDSTVFSSDAYYSGGQDFLSGTYGVKLTETVGTTDTVYEYSWVADPISGRFGECILSYANGLKKEGKLVTWSNDRTSYVETRTIRNASNQLLSKTEDHYERFPFGFVKVKAVIDPDGANLQTTYTYNNPTVVPGDPVPAGYGLLQQMVRYDGYWEQYSYDSENRLKKMVSQFLNSSVGDESASRVETMTFSASNPTETRIVTIAGQEVERHYEAKTTGSTEEERQDITCQSPGASWTASDNLVSKTCTYSTDHPTALLRGRTKWTKATDGTMTFHSYSSSSGNLTTIIDSGAPNGGGTAVVDGTKTTTVTNPAGNVISEEVRDIASGLVLSSWSATSTDALGRVTGMTYSDGTTRSIAYHGSTSACGSCSGSAYLIDSETDRDGVQSAYTYDALGRRTETTRLGITELSTLDALGRVLKRERIGTDDTVITLQETTYDLAGRVTQTRDAMNHATTHATSHPSGGGTLTTLTLPSVAAGTPTRIESVYGDGRTKEISGTAVAPLKYAYGTWSGGLWTQEIKVGTAGAETEWTKTYTDLAGHTVKVEYPDGAFATTTYNSNGQMVKATDPDGVATLSAYNGKGELFRTALDVNANSAIDLGGPDRVTDTAQSVVTAHGQVVQRTTKSVYASGSTPTVVQETDRSVNGRSQWQTAFGNTTSTVGSTPTGGNWTTTTTNPDNTQVVQTMTNTRLTSSVLKNSAGATVTSTAATYDAHGRLLTQTDARMGATTFAYDDADRVTTQTAPDPTGGSNPLVTSYGYDALGRRTSVTLPDTTVTTTGYDLQGNVISTGGSQTYDVSYTFDPQGRMLTMTTGGQAGNATTTWSYDSGRGWMTRKEFAGGKGTNYTYTPGVRLATRTWARTVGGAPLVTTYSYNGAGDLAGTDYSDSTPDVAMTYTRWGALETLADGTGTKTITYNAQLKPDQEIFPSAFFGGRILSRHYDSLHRSTGFDLGTSGDPDADQAVAYRYDTAGRLASVQDPNRTWTYSFVANSAGLVSGVTNGGTSVGYSYEPGRNGITGIENKVGSTTVSNYAYANNVLGQRTARSQSGTAFAAAATESFGYNAKGEVVNSAHSVESARNTAFDYDGIGNRSEATFGGVTTAYTANTLNQYTEIDPGTPVMPSYDDDGNMTSDGAGKTLVWDGENRLIEVRNASGNLIATYTYDGQSRRVKKVTTSLAPQGASSEVNLYDGWNRIATYTTQSTFALQNSLTWGRDLSGNLEGAGGVGGLLARNVGGTAWDYTYDANGNVSEVIDGSGNIAAHYEYDPFGNAVVATGSSVASNPWRFSTKPVDAETGYSYYGYRYYSPVDGRWVNRDPIEEKGGVNLYGFVANNPVTNIDKLGELPIGLKILAVYSERSSLSIATFILNRIPGTFHFNDDDLEMVPLTKNALDTFYENWVLEQSKTGKITTKWNYLDLPKTNLATGRWGIFGGIPLISTKWWLGETTKVIGSGKIEVRCQSNDFQFRKRAIALTWYDVISAKDNGYTAFDLDAVETFVNRNLQPILANSFVAQIHYLDNREELHTVLGGK